jgi:hypothetical protein
LQSDNALKCSVADKVFLGNSFLVHLRLGNDLVLIARGIDRALFDSLELGSVISASWLAEHCRMVTA